MPSFDSLIVARRDAPEVVYPLDAAPTSFATGTSSAFSAWQPVVVSLPSGFVLTRIIATLDVLGGAFHGGRIEVGIGAATFEVAIAELAFHSLLFDPVADDAGRQDLSWVPGNFRHKGGGARLRHDHSRQNRVHLPPGLRRAWPRLRQEPTSISSMGGWRGDQGQPYHPRNGRWCNPKSRVYLDIQLVG